MAAGLEQQRLEQRAGGLLALPLGGRGRAGLAELRGQRVTGALQLAELEQPRAGWSPRRRRRRQRRVDGGERVAELGLQAGDLLAQGAARGGLVDVRCDERMWRRGERRGAWLR